MIEPRETRAWVERLAALGAAVRDRIVAARLAGDDLATAVAHEGGDTIFAIDRHVEPAIEEAIEKWGDECKPLMLIAEGMGEDGRRRFEGGKNAKPQAAGGELGGFRLIIDPIDGTRNIMYDKRSAWFLAAVAEDRGEATRLSDAFAAAMVELPTSKQGFADAMTAIRGARAEGQRSALFPIGNRQSAIGNLPLNPSTATTLKHGFAQVSNFFPGTKVLASELMEAIARAVLGKVEPGAADIFDDQYMTTGGQMVELMLGHDRFCCDLRPLFYLILEKQGVSATRGLECHPYDCAGMLVAQRAGVILTDGFGGPLDAPMNVHTGVHWCGYANETLRKQVEPVIQQWLAEKGIQR
jgi:fructose-1,6-bisphosphatase/inositol monophosphatase family enzyme